jgi:hypothetical protein
MERLLRNLSEQAVTMHYLMNYKRKTKSCNMDTQLNAPLFYFVCNRETFNRVKYKLYCLANALLTEE